MANSTDYGDMPELTEGDDTGPSVGYVSLTARPLANFPDDSIMQFTGGDSPKPRYLSLDCPLIQEIRQGEINGDLIKKHTGGDTFFARDLFCESVGISPKMILLPNG